jgi:hypothetical protein
MTDEPGISLDVIAEKIGGTRITVQRAVTVHDSFGRHHPRSHEIWFYYYKVFSLLRLLLRILNRCLRQSVSWSSLLLGFYLFFNEFLAILDMWR